MLCIRFLGNISALTVSEVQTNRAWWCLTHTLPEAYARASAAAAAYEDDGRGEESVRLLNEVISASRMVDLFINALSPPFLAPSAIAFTTPATPVLRWA